MQTRKRWEFLIASVAFGACLFARGEAHAREKGSEKCIVEKMSWKSSINPEYAAQVGKQTPDPAWQEYIASVRRQMSPDGWVAFQWLVKATRKDVEDWCRSNYAASDESQKHEEEARDLDAAKAAAEVESANAVAYAKLHAAVIKSRCQYEGIIGERLVLYRKSGLSLVEALQKIREGDPNDELLRVRLIAPLIYASQMTEEQAAKEVETRCLITSQ